MISSFRECHLNSCLFEKLEEVVEAKRLCSISMYNICITKIVEDFLNKITLM